VQSNCVLVSSAQHINGLFHYITSITATTQQKAAAQFTVGRIRHTQDHHPKD